VSEANIPRIGLEGHKQPKVPTLICYDPNDKTKFSWGGQVDWKNESIQGVKLLLDPDQERPLYLPTGNIKSDLKKLPKPPVEVAADFIGAIYAHALSKIETTVPKDYLLICQKQFVLSVPAVWSDKAKDTTLRVWFLEPISERGLIIKFRLQNKPESIQSF
jgi:hypothetical protein